MSETELIGHDRLVGIFAPFSYLGVSHSIISTAELLKERGYKVDIFTIKQTIAKHILPKDLMLLERPKNKLWNHFPLDLLYFFFWSQRICRRKTYKCFIGYDPPGLTVASLLGLICKVPVIYHSLELWCAKDLPTHCIHCKWLPSHQMAFKYAERYFHKRAKFTIIQDKRRAQILCSENHIAPKEIFYVPHTGREKVFKTKSKPDYLRQKFGIDTHNSVLLMIGGINHTTLAYETALAAIKWPSSWHLVLHGFGSQEYLNMMSKTLDRERVTLSTELVPMAELSELIASSDIGLALYPNGQTNIYEMTSGKIGQYFRCGIPVIANNFPNLIDIVESSDAGLCVHSLEELPEAINNILKDYTKFRYNAYKAYSTYYDFDKAFDPVFQRIEKI